MSDHNVLRRIARNATVPFSALLELGSGAVTDVEELVWRGSDFGDDTDAWDPDYIERTLPLLRPLIRAWFRPEVHGLDNIPEGPSLLVGNHSGGLYIADTVVLAHAFYERFGPHRRFHQLAHDLAARSPLLGLLRRYGVLAASHENGRRALRAGAPLLVYPGGDYETFRPSWQQNEIQFGGRSGFIRLAQEEGVPIVPVVGIGGQETALFLTRGQRAARALRLDKALRIKVLPVSVGPPFGLNVLDFPGRIALPAKISLRVLPPIEPDTGASREDLYEHVTETMQGALDELADDRTLPVVG